MELDDTLQCSHTERDLVIYTLGAQKGKVPFSTSHLLNLKHSTGEFFQVYFASTCATLTVLLLLTPSLADSCCVLLHLDVVKVKVHLLQTKVNQQSGSQNRSFSALALEAVGPRVAVVLINVDFIVPVSP